LIELDVSIPSKEVILSGTLCLPHEGGEFPTALWLQGSGPLDRDDNVPGQALNNSKSIAHHLAENGVATLRFDKRGVEKSTGEFLSAGHSDFVEDGLSCLKFLSKSNYCDSTRLFAIGHSEGAIIAPQIAQKFEGVAGIILVCPAIEDPESLLMRQAKEIKKMVDAQSWLKHPLAKPFVAVLNPVKSHHKHIAKIKNSECKIGRLGLSKQPFHWFRQFLDLNLVEIYRNTKCPVFAIAGAKDFQCLPSDVYKIADVIQGEYEFHIIEDMSHMLRSEPGEACIFNYAKQLKQPIESQLLELICNWIQQKYR
jgi:uncharacterized protein